MLNEGVVLEVNSKEGIVMSPDKGIVILKRTKDMAVGKLIFFSDDQIYKRNSNFFYILSFGSVAAAIVLIAILIFSRFSYQNQIYAYVDIDINPSIALAINKNNIVLSVESINEDAKNLVDNLDIMKKPLDKAIMNVIEESISEGFISKENSNILFSAALAKKLDESESTKESERILAICKDTALKTTKFKTEVRTMNSTYEIKEKALLDSTTIGRYYIYEKLRNTDSSISIDSIKIMPVGDLFKHIDKIMPKQQQLSTSIPSSTSNGASVPVMSTAVQSTTLNVATPSSNLPTPSIGVSSQKATPSSSTPSAEGTKTKGVTPIAKTSTPAPLNTPTPVPNNNTSTNTSKPSRPSNSTKGIGSWKLNVQGSAKASMSVTDKKINITIDNKGTDRWDVAFAHPIEPLEVGKKYRVSFNVNALYNTKIYAKVGDTSDPFAEYWNNNWNPIEIQANSPVFISQEFTPKGISDSEEIIFHMGGELTGTVPNTVSIDDIIITQFSGSNTKNILNYDFEEN